MAGFGHCVSRSFSKPLTNTHRKPGTATTEETCPSILNYTMTLALAGPSPSAAPLCSFRASMTPSAGDDEVKISII